MNLEQNITGDGERRKSRILIPGTPEYDAEINRYNEANKKGRENPKPKPSTQPMPSGVSLSVDDLINRGKLFYSSDSNKGVAFALEKAVTEIENNGIIANMPYLIAGKTKAPDNHFLRKDWFTALSEEDVVIDINGKFVGKGKPVVLTYHGCGILASDPKRIKKAYDEGLTGQNAARFDTNEGVRIIEGILPTGESISIYSTDDVRDGRIPNPFGKYAIWIDFETAKNTKSGYHTKSEFMKNNLVLARAGTLEDLEKYFEKVKGSSGDSKNKVGNWHRLKEINSGEVQGRLLFLNGNCIGLNGNGNLNINGRFVGVKAPEVQ